MSLAGRGPLLLLLLSLSLSFLSSRGLPPPAFSPCELGFPKPSLSYPIAAEAQKFIASRVEELKHPLRTIRTDTKPNSLICVAFNSCLPRVISRSILTEISARQIVHYIDTKSCALVGLITKCLLFQ